MSEFITLFIPFAGTTLGAAMVFFMKDKISPLVEKALLGFAAGVMIAASIWSLLIPSIDMAEAQGRIAWLPALIGFALGIIFLLVLDTVIPHLHLESDKPEGVRSKLQKTTMMIFAVTLHNIPEGMAVGVVYAGAAMGNMGVSITGAFALSIGIAIQNFPEGAIVSMPLVGEGMSKKKAFLYGTLSGAVEPVGGFLTALLAVQVTPLLPYFLAFAAGAMLYVVIEELIPESQAGEHTNIGTIGAAVGFYAIPVYRRYLQERRRKAILLQFRDMLDSLSNSFSAGKNTPDAFTDAYSDLKLAYGEQAPIVKEMAIIVSGLHNNFVIEDLLRDMSARCGIDDINSFAETFAVCNRLGGNLKKVVVDSRDIISDKIEIEMEIQTTVAANKNEINIMCVMPFVIIAMMGTMGQASITANTPLNVLVKLIAIFMFVIAYKLGRKITDIKV